MERVNPLFRSRDSTGSSTTAAPHASSLQASASQNHDTAYVLALDVSPSQARRASVQPRDMCRFSVEQEHDASLQNTPALPAPQGVAGNLVVTAKYNIITFLPIFLFEMFSRVAYLYFLLQASLAWWRTVSPYGGIGSTMALAFVLTVGAVKAIWEDRKRHQEDARTNASVAHLLQADGTVKDIAWQDVHVGQLLVVRDGERVPADLLCLHAALPERVCFVKTTNLDGETNLKIKKPVGIRPPWQPQDPRGVVALHLFAHVEAPSANLHIVRGSLHVHDAAGAPVVGMPITVNEMLLRGCTLQNSKEVVGLVVYAGRETRIQKNSAKTPLKIGSFDRFLNIQIAAIIGMQLALCAGCTAAAQYWKATVGILRPYLALDVYVQGNYAGVAGVIITFLTFWVLYSYLVPISLFVTMEIVKFWQGFVFVNNDPAMKDPATGEHAKARNSGLNEDLGKVEYVFSDKTGTLTANEMQLRMISAQGEACGDPQWRLEAHHALPPDAARLAFDARAAQAITALHSNRAAWRRLLDAGGQVAHAGVLPGSGELGARVLDVWITVLVCQSLVVEPGGEEGAPPVYQGPSPDEVALVDAARRLGFAFVSRSMTHITLSMLGEEVCYEILNVFEFSSERGRMGVVAKAPDGTIRLFAKGADAKMLPLLRSVEQSPAALRDVQHTLHLFATKGLRTLVLASRTLRPEEYASWDARYQAAAQRMAGREAALAALAEEVEGSMTLVGCTAIEDKLQDGVPQAIQTLLDADIKVWMITGDKQETAINIGISCKLIRKPDDLLVCNADDPQGVVARLHGLLQDTDTVGGQVAPKELVIDGKTLAHILGTKHERSLALLGGRCSSVVVCRASPAQKAAIVRLMTEFEMAQAAKGATGPLGWLRRRARRMQGKMLSIGDGANDVAMIQAADIGVGIMGKEGRQAVNNSDYALGQFRFLTRLLLVHGTLSHYRLARLIKYSFYKNIIFAYVLFFFQLHCGFSGQTLIDGIPAAVYNVFFTSLPILMFALLDRPIRDLDTLLRVPQLYRRQRSLTTRTFWTDAVLAAIAEAAVVFFVPYTAMASAGVKSATDLFSLGKVVYIGLLGVITCEIVTVARYWTWMWGAAVLGSYLVVFPFVLLYPRIQTVLGVVDPSWYGPPDVLLTTPWFWIVLLAMYAITGGAAVLFRTAMWVLAPQDSMIVAEMEAKVYPSGEVLARTSTQQKGSKRDSAAEMFVISKQ